MLDRGGQTTEKLETLIAWTFEEILRSEEASDSAHQCDLHLDDPLSLDPEIASRLRAIASDIVALAARAPGPNSELNAAVALAPTTAADEEPALAIFRSALGVSSLADYRDRFQIKPPGMDEACCSIEGDCAMRPADRAR